MRHLPKILPSVSNVTNISTTPCISCIFSDHWTKIYPCALHGQPVGVTGSLPLEGPLESVHNILECEGADGRAWNGVLWSGEDAVQ